MRLREHLLLGLGYALAALAFLGLAWEVWGVARSEPATPHIDTTRLDAVICDAPALKAWSLGYQEGYTRASTECVTLITGGRE